MVGFDYAAAKLLVEPECEGLTVPVDDTEAWLAANVAVARLPFEERRAMGIRARIRAEDETWDRIVQRFEKILWDVRDRHGALGDETREDARSPAGDPGYVTPAIRGT